MVAGRATIGTTAVGNGAPEGARNTPDHKKPRPHGAWGAGSAYMNRGSNPLRGTYRARVAIPQGNSIGKGDGMSLLAALTMLVSGTPGTENRWWYLFADDEIVWYADSLTATVNNDVADFTYKKVYRKPDKRAAVRMIRSRIHCSQRMMTTVSATAYDPEGEVVAKESYFNESPKLKAIPPDSNAESLWLFACSPDGTWERLGFRSVFRPVERVTRDFYAFVEMGLPDATAIALARYQRDWNRSEIERVIDEQVPRAMQPTLRELYDLPMGFKDST